MDLFIIIEIHDDIISSIEDKYIPKIIALIKIFKRLSFRFTKDTSPYKLFGIARAITIIKVNRKSIIGLGSLISLRGSIVKRNDQDKRPNTKP